MADRYYEGIGRRKSSTARVRVMSGSGQFTVNEKPLAEFFPRLGDVETIVSPLEEAGERASLDVTVMVSGGGVTGQAGAIRLGLGRALIQMNPELDRAMRRGGHLT